jgi:phosphatidylserine decarboxylase
VQEPNSNKALIFWIKTDEQDDVLVHIELNSGFQHASTTLHPGERVGQGCRCGFVARECRVHVYMPKNSQSVAQVRDKVIAGKNIIANFIR